MINKIAYPKVASLSYNDLVGLTKPLNHLLVQLHSCPSHPLYQRVIKVRSGHKERLIVIVDVHYTEVIALLESLSNF